MKHDISKKYKISVCADGFVSIYTVMPRKKKGDNVVYRAKPLTRRLGAALPVYSVDDMMMALTLIDQVCTLGVCLRPGKAGTSIEPKAPDWPRYTEPDVIEETNRVGQLFHDAHMRITNGCVQSHTG